MSIGYKIFPMLFKKYLIFIVLVALLLIIHHTVGHVEIMSTNPTKLTQKELDRQKLSSECQSKRKTSQSDHSTISKKSSCVVHPDVSQGPYYIANELIRKDITDGVDGIPIELNLQVIDVNTCEPLVGAGVELWSADSQGYYAGFTGWDPDSAVQTATCVDSSKFNPFQYISSKKCMTDLHTFMRGVQFTDKNGYATFTANVPGYYGKRTAHQHMVIWTDGEIKHVQGKADAPSISAAREGGYVYYNAISRHVGELFYDDDVITDLYARANSLYPTQAGGNRTTAYTTLQNDAVFLKGGGFGILDIAEVGEKNELLTKGVTGTIIIYVDAQKEVKVTKSYHLFTDDEVNNVQ